MECKYEFEREVNEILWYSIFNKEYPYGILGNNFENDTFKIKSYNWNDEDSNDYHFWHKPSGLKIYWYKYPLRSPMCNMLGVTHEQFLTVLRDCFNSLDTGVYYDIKPWWMCNV